MTIARNFHPMPSDPMIRNNPAPTFQAIASSLAALVILGVSACDRKPPAPPVPDVSVPGSAEKAPEDLSNELRALLELEMDEDIRERIKGLIGAVMERDLRKAMEKDPAAAFAGTLAKDSPEEVIWVEVALREWLAIDEEKAMVAADEAAAKANPAVLDRIALAMARHAIATGSEETAHGWQARMVDNHLREVVEAEIAGLTERNLRATIRNGGRAAIQSMAASLEGEKVFWLEVAVDEYLVMDPNGAWEWYQQAGGKLPPAKHDRVALAFGRYALRMNDRETGFHWLSKIADDKLREEAKLAAAPR